MEDPQELLETILRWASSDTRVAAVVLTGSRARGQRVDQLSDLDIELIVDDPAALAADDHWVRCLGPVLVSLDLTNDEDGGSGWPTRLVVFAEGRKVDFTLATMARVDAMAHSGLNELYDEGYTVLLDKSDRLAGLPKPTLQPPRRQPPTQSEFSRVESEYWFESTQVAVYLERRDLWVVKYREHTMHQCLLTMLEWFAHFCPGDSASGSPAHTWHIGHHMDEWLPKPLWERALQVFAHADVEDTRRGLTASMDLFAEVSASVATTLGLEHRPAVLTR